MRDLTLDSSRIEKYKLSASGTVRDEKSSQSEETTSIANSHSSLSASGSTKLDLSFAIGDDEDDEDDLLPEKKEQPPRSSGLEQESSDNAKFSRSRSVSSSIDEAVPIQLRGMSEKARGKLPAGQNTFSRQMANLAMSDKKAASDSQSIASNKWVSLKSCNV